MGFLKAIGNGLNRAHDWLFPDEEKLRKVKSDNYKDLPVEEDDDDQIEAPERFDAWEEIDNFKMNFFLGSWATRKFKSRIIGEDKVKKELEELERKRAAREGRLSGDSTGPESEKRPAGKQERSPRDSLERELEKVEQERREKQRRKEEKL